MRLEDQDVAIFLSGVNSVRDGKLVGLSIRDGCQSWEPVINLLFCVPNGTEGDQYDLELSNIISFEYNFTNESTLEEIEFAKCLWTDAGEFYLSLDPWKESERFISDQDNDCFISKSATLTVRRS